MTACALFGSSGLRYTALFWIVALPSMKIVPRTVSVCVV
jgi:hypothetical protein